MTKDKNANRNANLISWICLILIFVFGVFCLYNWGSILKGLTYFGALY
jgi:hypothetical protein